MPFLKRILTAIGAIILIAIGGSGTQSSSLVLQGTGVIALIIGIIILFIFGRIMLRTVGCLVSFFIIGGIFMFIIYAVGGFSDGIKGVPANLKSFLGQSKGTMNTSSQVQKAPMLTETISSPKEKSEKKANPNSQGFNPIDYPAMQAPVNVVKGNILQLYSGQYIRLFGIDAPDLDQTCANKQGRSYFCGRQAASWLKSWLSNYELKCHLINVDSQSNGVAVCFLGQYDIAAALTNAGWAVATQEGGGIYKAYENVANKERRGLWQGQFYSPSDWRTLKNRKSEIKLIAPKKKKSTKEGLLGF